MEILDKSPILEFNYSDSDRLVTCKCCGKKVPIGETITKDNMTFCRDSARCVWSTSGQNIEVEVLPASTPKIKPLFGD